MKLRHLMLAAVAFTAMASTTSANAQTPAFSVTGPSGALANPPFTLGYAFSASQAFSLRGLGVFDADLDGLAESHEVGLWNSAGTLLASSTVASGTSGTLIADFRYATFAGLTLDAGTYRIGALYTSGADQLLFPDNGGVTTSATGFNYLSAQFGGGSALTDPTAVVGGPTSNAYFGPNLLASAAGVPEPASWALMIGGFGMAGGALRRRGAARTRVTFA